jgi:hypothetical protein
MPEESVNSLNANHERRLTVTCRYIDKLLADMENTLHTSESKVAFPHYVSDLSPQQRRVVEDYIRLGVAGGEQLQSERSSWACSGGLRDNGAARPLLALRNPLNPQWRARTSLGAWPPPAL